MAASRPMASSLASGQEAPPVIRRERPLFGPPTPLQRHLAMAFGGASVRREREHHFEVFSVQRSRPDEYRLALDHDLLRDGDEGVVPILESLRVVECMEDHPGALVRVREERPSGRLVVQVSR